MAEKFLSSYHQSKYQGEKSEILTVFGRRNIYDKDKMT
jgi:hypothetical protein